MKHNLSILEHLLLEDRSRVPSTDPGFLMASSALQITAHHAVLLTYGERRKERAAVAEEREAHAETLAELEAFANTEIVVEAAKGLPGVRRMKDADPELKRDAQRLKRRRNTTLLAAVTFVCSRTQVLASLRELPDGCDSVRRQLRTAIRLRTIRAYEEAIERRLEEHPTVAALLPPRSEQD